MPLPFYLTIVALIGFGWVAFAARRVGWGLPACLVYATVGVWYVGDALYNDYDGYVLTIGAESLESAWWQTLWFVMAFGMLAPLAHSSINRRGGRSHVMLFFETDRLSRPGVQRQLDVLGKALLMAWLILMGIGLLRVKGDVLGLFAPYLGRKVDPWGRGQIGGGFSAFISLASYFQIFLAAAFGVLAALARNPGTRNMAIIVCLLTFPIYIFDRTRNTMLATMMPGVLAFVLLRLRVGLVTKGLVLGCFFLVVNFWFSTVMASRSGMSFDIDQALAGEGAEEARHEGLNMFEELAWVNYFMETGEYVPNNGQRYFAELVNPVPRAIWKNKPMIGLDYAVARGQAVVGDSGEVTATISTGMIGQGVVNFGRFFGPLAAAALMSLWVALLARQDLLGSNPGRLLLYVSGLILTFNMGRDITLLVLYPFLFGLGLFLAWQHWQASNGGQQHTARRVPRRRVRGS